MLSPSPAPEPTLAADDISPAEARLAMMELANMISVPMALTAVIRLGVPAAIWANGANAPLPAAALLPPGHPDPSVLERLLRLLASRGVFSEHTTAGSTTARRYAITAVGRTLVPTGPSGASYADYVLQHHQDALVLAWPRLRDAVLDPAGPEPFARAHDGVPAYAYYGQDSEANEVTRVSEPFMEALLDGYRGGFEGVGTLVDIGGSSGACLEMILRRVSTIREGVNFDLPDVVAAHRRLSEIMPTDDKLSEGPLPMQSPPARLRSRKRRTGHLTPPTPLVKIRSVQPKVRTPPSSGSSAEEKPSSDLPAASDGLLEPKEVPKPSEDTEPVIAWRDVRLPTPVYVRVDRSGAYHSYPNFGGPFENLDAIKRAFRTYARGKSTDTPKERNKEGIVRELLEFSDGSRVLSTSLERAERETDNVNRLVKSVLDKKKDDDENFKYELKDIVHWQSICEHAHAWYYHLNITMTTKGADDDVSTPSLFFAEVTLDREDKQGYFLSSFCRIEQPDDNKEVSCYGCMNNGSTNMKHPNSHFDGGHVNTDFPVGFGPCNDKQCCDPQIMEDSKEEEDLRKEEEGRIIESYDVGHYLDDVEFMANIRNRRAKLLALNP